MQQAADPTFVQTAPPFVPRALLDWLLGTKGGIFGRRQLMALVDLHRWAAASLLC
jgi:hypothetical protein